jgi:hypothetical protein
VQRSYYEPVVTYQTRTYYEAVTTYRTSYYYQPVTTYRYSCYYDPCTCSYQQVATPTTCYQLRSQCCPVTSWVQRCCQVPVTTYRRHCYWEPETCCSLVNPCNGTTAAPAVTESGSVAVPTTPRVDEFRGAEPAAPGYNRASPPAVPAEGSSSSFRPRGGRAPSSVPVQQPKPPVAPRMDRIAFDQPTKPAHGDLKGQVVPASGTWTAAKVNLSFVREDADRLEQAVATDEKGKFTVTLASGKWKVYVKDGQGQSVFHSTVMVRENEVQQMTLVSR